MNIKNESPHFFKNPTLMTKRMYMFCLFAALSIAILYSSCNPNSTYSSDDPVNCKFHIGSWACVGTQNNIKVTFTHDTLLYEMYINGKNIAAINSKYSCLASNDTLFIQTIEEIPVRFHIIRIGQSQAVLAGFKGAKGIEDHIAGAFSIERISGEENYDKPAIETGMIPEKNIEHHNYILPDGFTGILAIAYNQPEGIMPTYDSLGNKTFSLVGNTDFLAKVQSAPDIICFAMNKIKFFYPGSDGLAIPLRSYKVFDTVPQEHLLKENHVFLVGYNRIGRHEISKIINDTIEGNILFLKVGKDAVYSENVFGTDSLLFAGEFHKLRDY
jgi:hypothetical protein